MSLQVSTDSVTLKIDQDEKLPEGLEYNAYQRALLSFQEKASHTLAKNKQGIKLGVAVLCVFLYFAYFTYALYYR